MKYVGTTRAQRNLLARDIRIVEARGSTPLYSTTKPAFRCRFFFVFGVKMQEMCVKGFILRVKGKV